MRTTGFLAAVALAFAACGSPATALPPAGGGGIDVPTTLHITCAEDGTHASPAHVQPTEGGVRVVFDNPAEADGYWVRAHSSPDDWNHGGRIEDATGFSDPPGRYVVVCYAKNDDPSYYEADERFAEFEIVDPNDLWIEHVVECTEPVELDGEPVPGATSERDVEEWIRDRFDLDDAKRHVPGYPWTQWKAEQFVLVRDGTTLASWFAYQEQQGWVARGDVCPD